MYPTTLRRCPITHPELQQNKPSTPKESIILLKETLLTRLQELVSSSEAAAVAASWPAREAEEVPSCSVHSVLPSYRSRSQNCFPYRSNGHTKALVKQIGSRTFGQDCCSCANSCRSDPHTSRRELCRRVEVEKCECSGSRSWSESALDYWRRDLAAVAWAPQRLKSGCRRVAAPRCRPCSRDRAPVIPQARGCSTE